MFTIQQQSFYWIKLNWFICYVRLDESVGPALLETVLLEMCSDNQIMLLDKAQGVVNLLSVEQKRELLETTRRAGGLLYNIRQHFAG